jgi:UDP-glucose 4-epimerase
MKILVTGGCGFIGSHLCRRLSTRGHDVRVLDDLSRGKRENVPHEVAVEIGDIVDRSTVARAFEGVDACVHLAAIASVPECQKDWSRANAVNLNGSVNVFAAAAEAGNVPVVYASSAAVYGDVGGPAHEALKPRPFSAYGVDKYASELHAQVAGHDVGLPSCGLRFFNVFGPGQDPSSPYSGVITIFVERLLRGEPTIIYGDGKQTRDFIYVEDVVDAISLALEKASSGSPVFNVCRGVQVDVSALHAELCHVLGVNQAPRFGPPRIGDIRFSVGSSQKAADELRFVARTSLQEGLGRLRDARRR